MYFKLCQNWPHVEFRRSHNDKAELSPWQLSRLPLQMKTMRCGWTIWKKLVADLDLRLFCRRTCVTKNVLFDVLESKVCGDGLTSVDRLLLCCTVHFFPRFVKSAFVPVVFSRLLSIRVSLCIFVLIRSKHKTKCQFQWILLVGVLWLLQSFRVSAVISNRYRGPSLDFILIRSFQGEDRFLKLYDHLSHSKSTQTSLFKPSCQCMYHFPLITLCTIMFPAEGEEKIDAFII